MTGEIRPYDSVKRSIDVVAGGVLFVLTLPLLGAVAAAVAIALGRPVIFKQRRPGRGGEIFTLYKFRTMRGIDPSRGIVTDEQRLTPFGRALRAASLDELPSLVNVLKGDMSFVGPRPLMVEYLPHYSPEQARRHEVRPGITGLAQVNGRNGVPWEERFSLDVEYVDRRSLALDLRILARTVVVVLSRSGISAEGHATMPDFAPSLPLTGPAAHDQTPEATNASERNVDRDDELNRHLYAAEGR